MKLGYRTDTDIPHISHIEPIPGSYRFFSYRYQYRVSVPGIGIIPGIGRTLTATLVLRVRLFLLGCSGIVILFLWLGLRVGGLFYLEPCTVTLVHRFCTSCGELSEFSDFHKLFMSTGLHLKNTMEKVCKCK